MAEAMSIEARPVERSASDRGERAERALAVLTAAADPIRWAVLDRLADGTLCVCDLQSHVPIAANLLSYHLRVLREAGLVTTQRRGRWVDYTLAADAHETLAAALPTTLVASTRSLAAVAP